MDVRYRHRLACFSARVFRNDVPAARFLWCWAIVPVLFFSLFKGKHHHYMLSCLAPAAVLGAWGAREFWQGMQRWPNWLRRPWISLPLCGLPGAALIYLLRRKIPGPDWVHLVWIIFWPSVTLAAWWIVSRWNQRAAFAGFCAVVVVVNLAVYEYRTRFADDYINDLAFVHETESLVPPGEPLLVMGEGEPLNPSWHLFYFRGRAQILHNETYLRDERLPSREVYLICRPRDEPLLKEYGQLQMLAQSRRTRFERSSADRYTLYSLSFNPDLKRVPGDVRMTPLQATGRDPGPFLGKPVIETAHRAPSSASRRTHPRRQRQAR